MRRKYGEIIKNHWTKHTFIYNVALNCRRKKIKKYQYIRVHFYWTHSSLSLSHLYIQKQIHTVLAKLMIFCNSISIQTLQITVHIPPPQSTFRLTAPMTAISCSMVCPHLPKNPAFTTKKVIKMLLKWNSNTQNIYLTKACRHAKFSLVSGIEK